MVVGVLHQNHPHICLQLIIFRFFSQLTLTLTTPVVYSPENRDAWVPLALLAFSQGSNPTNLPRVLVQPNWLGAPRPPEVSVRNKETWNLPLPPVGSPPARVSYRGFPAPHRSCTADPFPSFPGIADGTCKFPQRCIQPI